ncbi:hypothetical protein [Petrimonas sulfuriphila]|uniref:hypothetical protein n=1 Tax=Petrimonas sulfuriphila TaxID=285070 RepID=UPI003EC004E6
MYNQVKQVRRKIRDSKPDFWTEFAIESDIFTDERKFPDWVFDFRESHLVKLSPTMKKLCRNLKSLGVGFKIKYPVKVFDKWKFADIYIPKMNTVILVLSSYNEFSKPCCNKSDRAEFFSDKFRVVELYEYNATDMNVLKNVLKLQ